MQPVAIDNVCKSFTLGQTKESTALQRVLGSSQHESKSVLQVLQGVSLRIDHGEIYGLIGRNGCGKSTLLRIIAGIYRADSGSVAVVGRLIPLIHLDTAVKPRLTFRENIHLVCTLLGMSNTIIHKHFDTIVEYAGLTEFVDAKWYTFSDGMKQKAVFAIGVHAAPEILLLDEAFSAGDEAFRTKSLSTVQELAKKGVAVMMVGHNIDSMSNICDRIAWMEHGRIHKEGVPHDVVTAYRQSVYES